MTSALRPVQAGDRPFLVGLYGDVRAEELALVQWPPGAQQAFVEMQFTAQDAYYREYYPNASFDVVLVDGQPAGRLYVDRWPQEIRIVDISLLPRFRGRGIGTRLLGDLLAEAAQAAKPLSIHVEAGNPARSLYERLGFAPVEDRGTHVLMATR